MTNSLSEDIYALGELMAENLNTQGVASADADDGLTTLAGKILEIAASTTTLTIEVPLNLVYSDDFNITGTLTDGNDDAISGATVKLKVGNTVVDTDTTDSNGEVSFTQSPVSMGNHSFQLIFEGDSTHPAASSSVVTREIGKETSAITVSSPTASSSYYSDGSISVSGTLKTDDNEALSSANVLVKLGSTTLTTLTTGNDGSFSGSVSASNLSSGSNTLKFEFAGDTYYSTTYQEVAVTVNAVSLALTSNKSILSYADSDSCTLTATYTGAIVTGKTVKLCKASDDSEIATMTDNNDGTYTASYSSAGVGDIGFYAKVGSLVSENYIVHDYLRVFKLDGTESKYQISGTTSFSNGVMSGGCSYLQVPIDNTHDFELEFEVARTNGGCGVLIVPSGTTRRDYTELQIIHNILCWTNGSNRGSIYDGILPTTNYGTWYKVYIKKQGSTYSVSKDGENYTTLNLCNWAKTTSNWYIGLDTWSGASSLRNIYVKPL